MMARLSVISSVFASCHLSIALLLLAALASATNFPVSTCGGLQSSLTANGATATSNILLTADITCTNTAWTTIPSLAGTLNGQGHSLTFTGTTSISGAAFVDTHTGTIKNIRLIGAVIGSAAGSAPHAFLVATMNSPGLIENVDVVVRAGTYFANSNGAWIVAKMNGGSISFTRVFGDSTSAVTLHASSYVAGFIAEKLGGAVSDCGVFFMTLYGSQYVGGFVAYDYGGSITRSVVDGVALQGDAWYAGGFGGKVGASITQCAVLDTIGSGASIQMTGIYIAGFLAFCDSCTASDNYVDLPGGMICDNMYCAGFAGYSNIGLSNSYARLPMSGTVSIAIRPFITANDGSISSYSTCAYSTTPTTVAPADLRALARTDTQIFAGTSTPMSAWDQTTIWSFPGAQLRAIPVVTQAASAALGVSVTLPGSIFVTDALPPGGRTAIAQLSSTVTIRGTTTTPFVIKFVSSTGATVSPQPTLSSCFKVVMDLTTFPAPYGTTDRTVYGLSGSSWVQVDTFGSSCTAFRRATTLTQSGTTWTFFSNKFTQFALACGTGLVDNGSGVCVPGSTGGDPHFRGLAGQQYLINGAPGTVYNIISTPSLLVNALFGTAIGPHRYTVMHELGIVVGTDTVFANKYNRLQLNGKKAPASAVLSDGVSVLSRDINKTGDGITLRTPEFFLRWEPLNFEIDLIEVKLLRAGDASVHGLLGQTWNSGKWPASSLTTEITDAAVLFPALLDGSGESDYAVRDGLFGHEFGFSTFDSAAYPEVYAVPAVSKAGRKTK